MRRALPPGGEVAKAYEFVGEDGPVTLEGLFGDKETLVVYSYMFGPERKAPCPMCTSFMAGFEEKVADIGQRVALAFVARSPIGRLVEAKAARGWRAMPVYSDPSGAFTRDYVDAEDADMPGLTVFSRRDGTVRHFWSAEMSDEMADPGEDPRGSAGDGPAVAAARRDAGGARDGLVSEAELLRDVASSGRCARRPCRSHGSRTRAQTVNTSISAKSIDRALAAMAILR